MEESKENSSAKTPPEPSPSQRDSVGKILRDAREKTGISAEKLCADLRIGSGTLEALESGNFKALAGPPYVRAMLVSLSRYLHLDQKRILQAYAEESGNKPQTPTIAPYKDESTARTRSHKQIFILLLAVLLFILLLIMGKVTTDAPRIEPAPPSTAGDTVLNLDPLPVPEPFSDDSSESEATDVDTPLAVTTTRVDENVTEAEEPSPEAEAIASDEDATNRETRVSLLGISDSIWVRILPAGQREVSDYLSDTQPMEFTHTDAITFITRQSRTVRVLLDDTTVVPNRRRFVVDGDRISY